MQRMDVQAKKVENCEIVGNRRTFLQERYVKIGQDAIYFIGVKMGRLKRGNNTILLVLISVLSVFTLMPKPHILLGVPDVQVDGGNHLKDVKFKIVDETAGEPLRNRELNICQFVYFKLKHGAPSPYLDKKADWYIRSVTTDDNGVFTLDLSLIDAMAIVVEPAEPYNIVRFTRTSGGAKEGPPFDHISIFEAGDGTSRNLWYDLKRKIVRIIPTYGQKDQRKPYEEIVLIARKNQSSENSDEPVGKKAEEIANSYIKAIRKWNYVFLTEDNFAGLRREIRDFAGQYLHGRMNDAEFTTLIGVIENYGSPYFQHDDPASQLTVSESRYFQFRDQVSTFKWLLWQALTREPQTAENVKQRNAQRKWLREFIKTVPGRPGDWFPEVISRAGMYKWAEDSLEQKFDNPLSLMSEAMTDEQFVNFKEWMKRSSANGLSSTINDIRCRVIGARAHKHSDVEGVYQYPFDIELPFEDEVKATWGGRSSHLVFASNAQFRGKDVYMDARGYSILDVVKLSTMSVEPEADDEKQEEHFTQWSQQHNKGDLAYLHADARVITLRGAKLAELKVADWFEADCLSNDDLRKSIDNDGRTEISVKRLPPVNGPFTIERLNSRIFIVVETAEKRLAVIVFKNREFGQLYIRCRARDADSIDYKPAVQVEGGESHRNIAPGIEPLPHGRVGEMFDRIEKHDEIDLKLIYQSLIGPQTALRAYAARYLGTHGNGTSIPYLIDALSDESMHVGAEYPEAGMATTRYWANDSLKKLTGKDFGFIWNDPKNKRDEAIKRWQQWWQKNKPAVQVEVQIEAEDGGRFVPV